jgi:hypothetical protein
LLTTDELGSGVGFLGVYQEGVNFLPIIESGSSDFGRHGSVFGRLGINVLRNADMSLRSSTAFSDRGVYDLEELLPANDEFVFQLRRPPLGALASLFCRCFSQGRFEFADGTVRELLFRGVKNVLSGLFLCLLSK